MLAAGIIAEIGDVSRFKDQAALAQYAGLTWTSYQSGNFEAEEHSMTKACNQNSRYYLVEAAKSSGAHCPQVRSSGLLHAEEWPNLSLGSDVLTRHCNLMPQIAAG